MAEHIRDEANVPAKKTLECELMQKMDAFGVVMKG